MKITDEVIKKIENIFEFTLYDWQKNYLKKETEFIPSGRGNGKTFAYCIKFLLSDGEKTNKRDVFKYRDGKSGNYARWFKGFCLEINEKLVENGFETRIV